MNVVITGSTGFIGRHLTKKLASRGHRIQIFDRRFHDLTDSRTMKPLLEWCDVIYHLAGLTRADSYTLIHTNVLGTSELIKAVEEYASSPIKIIFASSIQVYDFAETPHYWCEDEQACSPSVYGLSKRIGEQLLTEFCSRKHSAIALRLSNVYGPDCNPFRSSVIATFAHLLAQGQPLWVNGTGGDKRDYIYIDDVVEAMEACLAYHPHGCEIFNISRGRSTSILELIACMESVSGYRATIQFKNEMKDQGHLLSDPARVKNCLGFAAKVSLEEGLSKLFTKS